MRILGIDPGFERLGIAILEKNKNDKRERVIFSICFKTSSKLPFNERLFLIGIEVKKIIKKYQPEILAIETLFLNTNQKTVMRVAEARGVVVYEASCAGLKVLKPLPADKNGNDGLRQGRQNTNHQNGKILVDIEKTRLQTTN